MEMLNFECLEHIFGFLNCGPKEWLLLSEVCAKWQQVVERFWKRINRITIVNNYKPKNPYLSTKKVIAIMEYAAQHVTEITLTARFSVNSIKLGDHEYNLKGLDVDAFLKTLEKCSDHISVAHFYPSDKLFNIFVRSNQNLKKLTLTLDKYCLSNVNPHFFNDKITSVEELGLIKKANCKLLLKEVLQSFPEVKKLSVQFPQRAQHFDVEMLDLLITILINKYPKLEELHFRVSNESYPERYRYIELLRLRDLVCEQMLTSNMLRVLELDRIYIESIFDVIVSFPKLEKLDTEICFTCLQTNARKPQKFSKLTSLTLRLRIGCDECYNSLPNDEDLNVFCEFLDKMPSLHELNIVADTLTAYIFNVKRSEDIVRHAVKLAISNERKVVINKLIEIVEQLRAESVKADESQTLNIKILYRRYSIESLFKTLKESFNNCKVTYIQ